MRARLVCMDKELRKLLGVNLWQIFSVVSVKIYTIGKKYQRETKQVNCLHKGKHIMFYWYEVEIIE